MRDLRSLLGEANIEGGVLIDSHIEVIPTIRAKWEDATEDIYDPRMRCSHCGSEQMPRLGWRFCPVCGAMMEVKE